MENTRISENAPELWKHLFPWPKPESHKYTRGHAFIVGHDAASTGATILAARAAHRLCGVVTLACEPDALPIYAVSSPASFTRPFTTVSELLKAIEIRPPNALLIGPGAGVQEWTREAVLALLSLHIPTVLDADALSAFAENPERLFAAIEVCSAPVVLTPHGGEFKRLFGATCHPERSEGSHAAGDPSPSAQDDKIKAALRAAKTSHAIVLFKGAETVIAAPPQNPLPRAGEGRVRAIINRNAPPTLAIAGAGDILAGMIAALLAGGMPAWEAAACAAWLHGEAAQAFGFGLAATDLPDLIPGALARLPAG